MGCMMCDGEELESRYEKAGYEIRRCADCRLTQLYPLPSPEERISVYANHYFGGGESGVGYEDYAGQEGEYLATFAEDVRRIQQFAPSGSLLDVGCGYGYFAREALRSGYDAHGVDVSADAIRIAEKNLPGRVYQGAPSSVSELEHKRFNVIFASHVIEHIGEPHEFVADLVDRLEVDGVLVLVTPNVESLLARISGRRWVSFKVPEHVAYYSPRTISDLLERAGLRVLAVDSARQHYALPFLMGRIRDLIHPVGRLIPHFENTAALRSRSVRATSGSIRVIAARQKATGPDAVGGGNAGLHTTRSR
jgi:SAM-dependent methyltransferase